MPDINDIAKEKYPDHFQPDEYHYPNGAVKILQRMAFGKGYTHRDEEVRRLRAALEKISMPSTNEDAEDWWHYAHSLKSIASNALKQQP